MRVKVCIISVFLIFLLSNAIFAQDSTTTSTPTEASENSSDLEVSETTGDASQNENNTVNENQSTVYEKKIEEISLVDELTSDNYFTYKNANKKFIVFFYTPTCGHCNAFQPVWESIAKEAAAKNLPVSFAKVDIKRNQGFAERFKINEVPTLVYLETLENGQLMKSKFVGKRAQKSIITYLTKKNNYRPRELVEYEKFKVLVKKSRRFVIFLGDKTTYAKELENVIHASLDWGIENIFWTKSPEFFEKYNVDQESMEIIYHTNLDSKLDAGTPFELVTKPIKALTRAVAHRLVQVYTNVAISELLEENVKDFAMTDYPILLVLSKSDKEAYNKPLQALTNQLAKDYRRDFYMFYAILDGKYGESINDLFNIKSSELPALAIFPPENLDADDIYRYLYKTTNNTLSEEEFTNFAEGYKNNILTPYRVSAPVPQNPLNAHGVYTLVGDTFEDVIKNTAAGKHVLLNICSNEERCVKFNKRFNRIADKLKNNEKLFFATIDPVKNEFEGANYGETPTVVMFHDGIDKFDQIILYGGSLATRPIITWIKKQYKRKTDSLNVIELDDDFSVDEEEVFDIIKPYEEGTDEKEEEPEEKSPRDALRDMIMDHHQTANENKAENNNEEIVNLDNEHIKEGL